ncbi:MAG: hypothetical protein AAFX99_27665 [Myxococcota bacterium]
MTNPIVPYPGRYLLHPYVLAAIVLIIVNDAVLKPHYPGLLSGKLSDVGLCFLLPVFLTSAVEWASWGWATLRRETWSPSGWVVHAASCGVTVGYFSALQLWPAFVEFHLAMLRTLVPGQNFVVTMDPWDLVTLPMTGLAWVFLQRQAH